VVGKVPLSPLKVARKRDTCQTKTKGGGRGPAIQLDELYGTINRSHKLMPSKTERAAKQVYPRKKDRETGSRTSTRDEAERGAGGKQLLKTVAGQREAACKTGPTRDASSRFRQLLRERRGGRSPKGKQNWAERYSRRLKNKTERRKL